MPFYVGKTIDMEARLEMHFTTSTIKAPPEYRYKERWIHELFFTHSLQPKLKVVDKIETDSELEAHRLELQWILKYLKEGYPLTNKAFDGMEDLGYTRKRCKRRVQQCLYEWAKSNPDSEFAKWLRGKFGKRFS